MRSFSTVDVSKLPVTEYVFRGDDLGSLLDYLDRLMKTGMAKYATTIDGPPCDIPPVDWRDRITCIRVIRKATGLHWIYETKDRNGRRDRVNHGSDKDSRWWLPPIASALAGPFCIKDERAAVQAHVALCRRFIAHSRARIAEGQKLCADSSDRLLESQKLIRREEPYQLASRPVVPA